MTAILDRLIAFREVMRRPRECKLYVMCRISVYYIKNKKLSCDVISVNHFPPHRARAWFTIRPVRSSYRPVSLVLLRIPSSRPSPRTFPQFVRVQVLEFLAAENNGFET